MYDEKGLSEMETFLPNCRDLSIVRWLRHTIIVTGRSVTFTDEQRFADFWEKFVLDQI